MDMYNLLLYMLCAVLVPSLAKTQELLFTVDEPIESYNESVTASIAYPFTWLQTTTLQSIPNEASEEDVGQSTDAASPWLQTTQESADAALPWLQTTQKEEVWNNETTPESAFTVREDTKLEVVLNMTFAAVFAIAIFTGNILLLTVMWKYKPLQTSNRLIRTMIAVNDMIISIAVGNLVISTSAFKQLSPTWFCLINTKVTVFCFCISMNMSALLAVERCIFIVHPMRYLVWVTKTKVVLSCVAIISSPIIFITVFFIIFDEALYLHASMTCTIGSSKFYLLFVCIILPGILIIGVAIIRLSIFLRRCVVNSAEAIDGKKAIKLILLLSGALFGTFIPSFVLRMAILQVWSKEELNAGVNIPAFIAVRCTSFILTFVSSACNPIVQFYVENDLWVGLRKILGRKAYFAKQVAALEASNARN